MIVLLWLAAVNQSHYVLNRILHKVASGNIGMPGIDKLMGLNGIAPLPRGARTITTPHLLVYGDTHTLK